MLNVVLDASATRLLVRCAVDTSSCRLLADRAQLVHTIDHYAPGGLAERASFRFFESRPGRVDEFAPDEGKERQLCKTPEGFDGACFLRSSRALLFALNQKQAGFGDVAGGFGGLDLRTHVATRFAGGSGESAETLRRASQHLGLALVDCDWRCFCRHDRAGKLLILDFGAPVDRESS